jgi:hypothetical protein
LLTNWVELGNGSPHPGLGRPGNAINRLPVTTATCQNCTGGLPPILCPNCSNNLITSGLTSGYYGGEDPPFGVKPPGKCSHGGAFDSSANGLFGEGINKDSTDCDFSPHNFLHGQAAAVAKEATKQFIRDIKDRVTPRQIKLLLGVGPTLAIAIDTTGSMGGIIKGVKNVAIQIINARLGTTIARVIGCQSITSATNLCRSDATSSSISNLPAAAQWLRLSSLLRACGWGRNLRLIATAPDSVSISET